MTLRQFPGAIRLVIFMALVSPMLSGCSALGPVGVFIALMVAVDYLLRAAIVIALVIMGLRWAKALSRNDRFPPNTVLRVVIVLGLCISATSALIQWHSGKRERERTVERQPRQRAVERES